MSRQPPVPTDATSHYRRGAVMGMTMAEAFLLITFALLLLLALWKVQDDLQRQAYEVVEDMSPMDLVAAASLQESGQLQAVNELVAQGADFRAPETTPATQDRWRLIDKDELHRIVDGVESLPEHIQRDLADLVEIAGPARLRQILDASDRALEDELATLSDQDIVAAVQLSQSGQLETVAELVAQGADFRTPESMPATREAWRLIEEAELLRVIDSVEPLSAELQSGIADLVETKPEEDLAKLLSISERPSLTALGQFSNEDIEAALRLAQSGQLAAMDRLVAEGTDFRVSETTPATQDDWRLVEDEDAQRILDSLRDVPEPLRQDLAALLASETGDGIARLIEAAADTSGEAEIEERLAGIGRRLAQAEEEARSLVDDLREELGATVSAIGGAINDSGSIVLPDEVLFEQGSAEITPVMREFLDSICEPWLRELMDSSAPVVFAQIEGHASSEWRQETSPDEAYLKNLALSQARSQAVLDTCLRIVEDGGVRGWAHAHLAAVGYSSGQRILMEGVEDPERSRRVVFSIGLDDARLLDEVASDVAFGVGEQQHPPAR